MNNKTNSVTGARNAVRVIILSRNTAANAWFAKFPDEGAPIETAFTLSMPYIAVQAEIARRNPQFTVISDGFSGTPATALVRHYRGWEIKARPNNAAFIIHREGWQQRHNFKSVESAMSGIDAIVG